MIVQDATQLGSALAARRRSLHLTQGDLADVVGVNRRVIGELERGKSSVRLEIVLELVRALGLDLDLRARER